VELSDERHVPQDAAGAVDGKRVVFKPASFTPWSGVFMAGLFEQAVFRPACSTA
jgi:acyl-CoA reductase-like NAD-dependent aldehyde dehydrogenase